MSRELDAEIARVLEHISPSGMYWHEDQEAHLSTPAPYSSEDYYTHVLEDEIERRGLKNEYLLALSGIVIGTLCLADYDEWWALIRATPEQRARAFLEAAKG
jgi:hypothetical protein